MSPYSNLPSKKFWRLSVPDRIEEVKDLYKKKFSISGKNIATAGSCFAQEIARGLRKNGYSVIDAEPCPGGHPIRGEIQKSFGYGLYSARHGNIYTSRQLLQLCKEAFGILCPHPDVYIWKKEENFFDAFRPSVEPCGLPSQEEVIAQRLDHLKRFRKVLLECDIFIFTLGLTETWEHTGTHLVFPTAPGVIAGQYDSRLYQFKNLSFLEVYNDFVEFRTLVKENNPKAKFILTVSPVPLTATASNDHVLVATVRSKSILRAVAGQLYDEFVDVDYFPSYEIFSTPFLGKPMFMENKRTVSRKGVAEVMKVFFSEHNEMSLPEAGSEQTEADSDKVVCEEALLDAFAGVKNEK
nr:GSCFA domain-containing protein [uncultured Cohaesibacter sp.]